jgi:hypothetical protein
MTRRRLALAALVGGLAIVAATQRLGPITGPPLYDGVIVEAPYQWLAPAPGFAGGAQSTAQTLALQGGQSPNLGIGTTENPPQAQVFAGAGFLNVPSGTSSINVSIQPVPPDALPSDGIIVGNVYRFSLTNQSGAPVSGQASGGVTIVLRGPANVPVATIKRFSGGSWTALATDPAGQPNMFTAVVTDFGDFALVAPPGWTPIPQAPGQVGPVGPVATAGSGGPTTTPQGTAETGLPFLPALAVVLVIALAGISTALLVVSRRRRVTISSHVPSRPPRPARSSPRPDRTAPIARKIPPGRRH